jgi:hypothetical protein
MKIGSPIMGTAQVTECINNCRAVGGTTSSAADAATFSAVAFADELVEVDVSLVDLISLTRVILLSNLLSKVLFGLERFRGMPLIWHRVDLSSAGAILLIV